MTRWLQACYLQYQLTLHREREGELRSDTLQSLHQHAPALSDRRQ